MKTFTPLVLPTNLPTAISTLVPQTTQGTENAYPAATAPVIVTPPTVQASSSPTGNPYPAKPVSASPTAKPPAANAYPGPPQPAPSFKDCARTPGLVGCSANAIPVTGILAFIDEQSGDNARLIGVDLETGQGWQINLAPGPALFGMDWSREAPGGENPRLLVASRDNSYLLYSAVGKLLDSFSIEQTPSWQPGGVLSRDGSVRSVAGDEARLEQTSDLHWTLHIKTAQGEQRSLPLNSNPGDILYILRAWVPAMQKILAQTYFASNQAMTQGGQVISIDAKTGAVQPFDARMSLPGAVAAGKDFAWDPAQPGLMAFLETGQTDVTAPRLGLFDFQTGKLTYPLPDGIIISGVSWHPDGRLAFAVNQVNGLNSSSAQKDFPGPGIYLLDPQSGNSQLLVQTPQSATDTWPQWTADGQVLIYGRFIKSQTQYSGGRAVQVHAFRLSDGRDWVLVEGLAGPGTAVEPGSAQRLLAFSPK